MIRAGIIAAICLLLASPLQAACRQALALALDVSGSVDAREYRLQLDGLATALSLPEVREKLLAQTVAPVALLVFEWSGPQDQHLLVPWTRITGPEVLAGIIRTLNNTQRRDATPGTALGEAMMVGAAHLGQQAGCWKRTLDISGDGKSNLGPRPRSVKDRVAAKGVTVNGLVIGADAPDLGDLRQADIGELAAYFNAEVITGPGAFIETALGFDDYADAMVRKLVRELEEVTISARVPVQVEKRNGSP